MHFLTPYIQLARLDRPIGWWLLLLPCWWSITLASAGQPDLWLMGVFLIGAIVMRSAGCVYNDMIDRDFDKEVARTRSRPLAAGTITLFQAQLFLAALLGVGLIVLLQLNPFATKVGLASLGLVALYPFMKRWTYWPQLWLGLTFNWGALLGWAAVRGTIELPAIFLYVAGIFWTLGYDTIYAHQDKEDDILIGVKSTALKLGDKTRLWLAGFYGLTLIFLTATGIHPIAVILAAIHFAWQIKTANFDDGANCLARFKSNKWFGLIVLGGFILKSVIPA